MSTSLDQVTDLPEGCYRVPMSLLLDYIGDPFELMVWDCPAFTREDVLRVTEDEETSTPYNSETQDLVAGQSSYHTARIAYLIRHGWDDSGEDLRTPILEVAFGGEYGIGAHPLLDGNHRFAAAILRGDEFFTVYIDGDLDQAEKLLGI